jgi:hypothetical protein
MTPATIMLVIGFLAQSPIHGFIFVPEDRLVAPTLEECWEMAVSITRDPRTPQIAMCVPGRVPNEKKLNDAGRTLLYR